MRGISSEGDQVRGSEKDRQTEKRLCGITSGDTNELTNSVDATTRNNCSGSKQQQQQQPFLL